LGPQDNEFKEALKIISQDYPVGVEYLQIKLSDEFLNGLTNLRAPYSTEKLKTARDLKIYAIENLKEYNQVRDEEINEKLKTALGEGVFLEGQAWYDYIIGKDNNHEEFLNRKGQVEKAINYC